MKTEEAVNKIIQNIEKLCINLENINNILTDMHDLFLKIKEEENARITGNV